MSAGAITVDVSAVLNERPPDGADSSDVLRAVCGGAHVSLSRRAASLLERARRRGANVALNYRAGFVELNDHRRDAH